MIGESWIAPVSVGFLTALFVALPVLYPTPSALTVREWLYLALAWGGTGLVSGSWALAYGLARGQSGAGPYRPGYYRVKHGALALLTGGIALSGVLAVQTAFHHWLLTAGYAGLWGLQLLWSLKARPAAPRWGAPASRSLSGLAMLAFLVARLLGRHDPSALAVLCAGLHSLMSWLIVPVMVQHARRVGAAGSPGGAQ